MGAPDLIFELRSKGYSIQADGDYLDISPADNLPPELVKQLKQSKADILIELQREARRQKALAMLNKTPPVERAIITDADSDPMYVFLTIAIRGKAVGELRIPKEKYDPWQLMGLIERHGQATH